MSEQQIEGVPDGWRLVRISKWPKVGEYAIYSPGEVVRVTEPDQWELACIVEEIKQPKQHRPFANAAEFEPHRDRWWRFKKDEENQRRRPESYNDRNYWGCSWQEIFELAVFDDGTPFGVDITE